MEKELCVCVCVCVKSANNCKWGEVKRQLRRLEGLDFDFKVTVVSPTRAVATELNSRVKLPEATRDIAISRSSIPNNVSFPYDFISVL